MGHCQTDDLLQACAAVCGSLLLHKNFLAEDQYLHSAAGMALNCIAACAKQCQEADGSTVIAGASDVLQAVKGVVQ